MIDLQARLLESGPYAELTPTMAKPVMRLLPPEGSQGNERSKQDTELAIYREKTLNVLREEGFYRQDNEGNYIIQPEKFYNMQWEKQLRNKIGRLDRKLDGYQSDAIFAFVNAFDGITVYSEAEYTRKELGEDIEASPLFYRPKDNESALDIDAIKKAKFQMGIWELGQRVILPPQYPTESHAIDSGLSTYEAIAACIIYNPKYGNGERDSSGRLMVDFPEPTPGDPYKKTRKPILYKFFEKWKYEGSPGVREHNVTARPAEFFTQRCPKMIEKGLIDPQKDFTIYKGSYTYEVMGENIREVAPSGTVNISGIHYYLGSEFVARKENNRRTERKGYYVQKISDKLAGILRETGDGLKLESVMELHSLFPDQVKTQLNEQTVRKPYISRENLRILPVDEYLKENVEAGSIISDFSTYLEFSRRISSDKQAAFSIQNLSVKEQGFAAALYKSYGEDPRFWEFIRKHKLDGLRVLMVARGSFGNAEQIWQVSEQMRPAIVRDVAQIVQKVTAYRDNIRASLNEDDKTYGDQVADMIIDHTGKLLFSASAVTEGKLQKNGQNPLDLADVEFAIRSFREKIDRMYAQRYGLKDASGEYQQLLDVYSHSHGNPNVRALALSKMEQIWQMQIAAKNSQRIEEVEATTREFYGGNKELYENVNETTGDTEMHRQNLLKYVLKREAEGRPIKGAVLDMGCGQVSRMTDFIAKNLPQSQVVGVDLESQTLIDAASQKHEPNVQLASGNFAHIPLIDNSISLVTANWSVLNDLLLTKLQLNSFNEVARVLKPGGEFYFDVPSLEGEGENYSSWADEYQRQHKDEPRGMIEREFPGERKKKFFIYPKDDLQAKLERAGFEIVEWTPWNAANGLARQTVVARLKHKVTVASLDVAA